MTDYAVLFRELAIPRLVGTPNHRKVREILKRELSARGFVVDEHQFTGRPARALLGTEATVGYEAAARIVPAARSEHDSRIEIVLFAGRSLDAKRA